MKENKRAIPKFRIRKVQGWRVIDREGNQISPDMLSEEEAEYWVKERRKDEKYY